MPKLPPRELVLHCLTECQGSLMRVIRGLNPPDRPLTAICRIVTRINGMVHAEQGGVQGLGWGLGGGRDIGAVLERNCCQVRQARGRQAGNRERNCAVSDHASEARDNLKHLSMVPDSQRNKK